MKKTLIFAASCAAFAAFAGVPIKWSVETSRAEERVIDVYHGESLDMEVTFKTYGQILELPTNEVAATFWQTNGMNTAYWRTNNVEIIASNGIMRTTFGPEQDVGAKTLRGFIGIAGQIYRAAFVLRFKDAPGYNPAIVEWPYRRMDFNTIEVVNAPYYLKSEVESRLEEIDAENISLAYVAEEFSSSKNYKTGDVVLIGTKFYVFVDTYWSGSGDPIEEGYVEEVNSFKEIFKGVLKEAYLPLGFGGTNEPSYKVIDMGYDGGRGHLILEPSGIEIDDKWGGRTRFLGSLIQRYEGGSLLEKDIKNILTTDNVAGINSTTIQEEYKYRPTSPYYVYSWMTNNYLTKGEVEEGYISKSGFDGATKEDVSNAVEKASEKLSGQIKYIYNEARNLRLDYKGTMERLGYDTSSTVNLTNAAGKVMTGTAAGRWTYTDPYIGSMTFERRTTPNFHDATIVYTSGENLFYGKEEYPGAPTIKFFPMGFVEPQVFYADGNLTWTEVKQFATTDDIADVGNSVSNIVTESYIKEKLGVYLYEGEDGGIYVHTNEE